MRTVLVLFGCENFVTTKCIYPWMKFNFAFCSQRMSDYRYDWDRVTSLKGVSGVYMLMTYARVSSLLRKATAEKVSEDSGIASNQELLVMAHKTVKKNAAAALGEEIEGGLSRTLKQITLNDPQIDRFLFCPLSQQQHFYIFTQAIFHN